MGRSHQALIEVAQAYCGLIESAVPDDDVWLTDLSRLLPKLHALVVAVDPIAPASEHELDPDLDSRFELYSHLHETLGERDSYWLEFDSPRSSLPLTGSLADDLTDIYYDLKSGLDRLAAEDDPWRTLRDWQTGFSMHWGQHLLDAERHLYALSSRNLLA